MLDSLTYAMCVNTILGKLERREAITYIRPPGRVTLE